MAVMNTIKMYPLEYELLLQPFMSPHRYALSRKLFLETSTQAVVLQQGLFAKTDRFLAFGCVKQKPEIRPCGPATLPVSGDDHFRREISKRTWILHFLYSFFDFYVDFIVYFVIYSFLYFTQDPC